MIRNLYDNSIVAYKTATQQTVNLVLDTIRLAMKKEKNWSGAANATPLRLKLNIPTQDPVFVLSAQTGAV